MDEKQIRLIGKQIIDALYERKGFEYWWEEIDHMTHGQIIMNIGRRAIKAVKAQQG